MNTHRRAARSLSVLALVIFLAVFKPAYAADAGASLNDPVTDVFQFCSAILVSIESVAHDLATAFSGPAAQTSASAQSGTASIQSPAQSGSEQPPQAALAAAADDVFTSNSTTSTYESQPATTPSTQQQTQSGGTSDQTQATYSPSANSATSPVVTTPTANFVTQDQLNAAFSSRVYPLINIVADLTSLLPSLSAPPTSNTGAVPQQVAADGNPDYPYAAENAINSLSNVTINNANITNSNLPSGSGGNDLPLAGGTLTGDLIVNADTTANGNFAATGTSTLAGVDLTNLNCSSYGNGGKLTTDSFGNVICGTDQGGAGSTVAGADTQVQFNSGGGFDASSNFTFSSSTNKLTVTNASTSNLTATYASTSNLVASNSFTLGNLSGFLKATAGSIGTSLVNLTTDVTGILPIANGGTGILTAPSYGQVLVGNGSGGYNLIATSSLGVSVSNAASSTLLADSNTFSGNDTFSNPISGSVTGNAGTATALQTGHTINSVAFNGTANIVINAASSTLLSDANSWSKLQSFANSSSTLTTLGTTWFSGIANALLSTNANGQVVATTSIGTNFLAGTIGIGNGGTGIPTTPSYGQLLVGNGSGGYSLLATSSLGITGGGGNSASSTLLSDNNTFSGSDVFSSLLKLTSGLFSSASSTIGSGTQAGGLTIFGGATTTGNAYFAANLGIGTTSPGSLLALNGVGNFVSGATSTLYHGLNITTGCFSVNGTCVTGTGGSGTVSSGTTGQFAFYNVGGTTVSGTSTVFVSTAGNIGIGTTSPATKLSVYGGDTHLQETTDSATALVVENAEGTSTLQVSTLNSSSDLLQIATSTGSVFFDITAAGNVGVGTTSPAANFTVNGTTGSNLLQIASSTNQNILLVNQNGYLGLGTTTPGSIFSVNNVLNLTAATSTFYSTGGINLTSGCFSINGTCITGGGGNSASSTLLSDNNTFSGSDVFSSLLKLTSGLFSSASSTIGSGTQAGGLTIFGGATTTGNAYFAANLGIGTTSPGSLLALNGVGNFVSGATSTLYHGLNITTGCFSVNGTCVTGTGGSGTVSSGTTGQFAFYNVGGTTVSGTSTVFVSTAGNIGIGTTSPATKLSVYGGDTHLQETTDSATALVVENAEGTSTLQVSTLNSSSDLLQIATSTGSVFFDITAAGNVGVGTTSPAANFTVNGTTGSNLLQIASSTNQNILLVNQNGYLGLGTTTPGSIFSVNNVLNLTAATSTFYSTGGINLTSGCFSINGTCITGGGGNSASSTLLSDNNTFSGSDVFSSLLKLTSGLFSSASSTIGSGTQAGGLTIFGGATTTGNAYFAANLGIGTTSPGSLLALNGVGNFVSGATSTLYHGLNITTGCFSVNGTCVTGTGGSGTVSSGTTGQFAFYNVGGTTVSGTSTVFVSTAGNIGIGTTSPATKLSVYGGDTHLQETTDSATALVVENAEGTSTLQVSTLNSSSDLLQIATSTGSVFFDITAAGNVGVGTTSPAANFTVNGTTGSNLLQIASSTNQNILLVNQNGYLGLGTTTPGSIFSVNNVLNLTAATSTFYSTGGINLTSGCFSINGTCITGGGGNSASSTLLSDNNTFSGSDVFSSLLKLTSGLFSSASSTIGSGTQAGGLTINGGATTTGNAYFAANLGIGTTSPGSLLALNGVGNFVSGATSTLYHGLNITTGCFSVNGTCIGAVGGAASSTLLSDNNTFSGSDIFSSLLNLTGGLFSSASSTIGSGTQAGGLTIFGGATTTGNAYFAGKIGIGTTTPFGEFSISANNGTTYPGNLLFDIASSTSGATTTLFDIVNTGKVGVGTTTPWGKLSITGADALITTPALVVANSSNTPLLSVLDSGDVDVGTTTDNAFLSVQGYGTRQIFDVASSSGASAFHIASTGNIGVASTTPWANLSVSSLNSPYPEFTVGSTTLTSLLVSDTGNVGIGTTTPGSLFSLSGIANFTAATSSFFSTGGINLATGCFSVNGTCIGAVGGAASSTLLSDNNTFSGSDVFSSLLKLTSGLFSSASSTIGSGTQAGGLTIFGGATTTGNAYFAGRIGIGTTSPGSLLSVQGVANWSAATSTYYSTGGINLTAGCFSINGTCISGGGGSGTVSSGTQGQFAFYNAGGTTVSGTSTVFISTAGNVGIGTTSPSAKLTVGGILSGAVYDLLHITNYASATSTASQLSLRQVDTSGNATTTGAIKSILTQNYAGGGGALTFSTLQNGTLTEAGRFTSAGLFGIGTSSPYSRLTVWGNGSNNLLELVDSASTTAYSVNSSGNVFTYGKVATSTIINNTSNAWTIATSTTASPLFDISTTAGSETVSLGSPGSNIIVGDTNSSPNLLFQNNALIAGLTGAQTLTFGQGSDIINFGVNVGVGTTTPYSRLTLWGPDTASTSVFVIANSASTTEFNVLDNGNATLAGTLTQNSDERLKTNIQPLDASSSLSLLNQLTPVTFNWIDPNKGTDAQLGFIAQQVQPIFPNLVSTTSPTALTPDGTLSLNYIGFISPIISAIQELSSDVTTIESTIAGFAQSFTTQVLSATEGHFTNELCVGSTCVTPAQFQAMVAAANASQESGGSSGSSSDSGSSSSSDTSQATDTPPVIDINGDDPATVQVGASYSDLGATITGPLPDLNLGIEASVDGGATTSLDQITIDTTNPGTHTIIYSATDQNGLVGYATRTVDVVSAQQGDQGDTATSTDQTATSTPPDQGNTDLGSDDASSTSATSTPPDQDQGNTDQGSSDASSTDATSTQS